MSTSRNGNGTVGAVGDFLTSMPNGWKAFTALVGAASMGLTCGIFFVGFRGLPAQVRANTDAIRANLQAIDELRLQTEAFEHRFDDIVCLITLPDDLGAEEMVRRCGL